MSPTPFASAACPCGSGGTPALSAYIWLIQGTPVLIVLLVCYVAVPGAIGIRASAQAASVVSFSLFLAVYCAEDMRAGRLAVPLIEAAQALGLARGLVFRRVVLPLAAWVALPALIGQYVRMLKYTSVASVIGWRASPAARCWSTPVSSSR